MRLTEHNAFQSWTAIVFVVLAGVLVAATLSDSFWLLMVFVAGIFILVLSMLLHASRNPR